MRSTRLIREAPNTLVYKRTHSGDPSETGVFGIHDCMGSVRQRGFDAVIGVGGKSPWSSSKGIALKINWVGIGPMKEKAPSKSRNGKPFRGPLVTFETFVYLGEDGPDFKSFAPNLYRRMFEERHVRSVMSRSLPSKMQEDVLRILRWADKHSSNKHSRKSPTPGQNMTAILSGDCEKIPARGKC